MLLDAEARRHGEKRGERILGDVRHGFDCWESQEQKAHHTEEAEKAAGAGWPSAQAGL
jgi:hypothetical protein